MGVTRNKTVLSLFDGQVGHEGAERTSTIRTFCERAKKRSSALTDNGAHLVRANREPVFVWSHGGGGANHLQV